MPCFLAMMICWSATMPTYSFSSSRSVRGFRHRCFLSIASMTRFAFFCKRLRSRNLRVFLEIISVHHWALCQKLQLFSSQMQTLFLCTHKGVERFGRCVEVSVCSCALLCGQLSNPVVVQRLLLNCTMRNCSPVLQCACSLVLPFTCSLVLLSTCTSAHLFRGCIDGDSLSDVLFSFC